MESLRVEHFGPIGTADVSFGDLTFLIGPQASGKSLFLELLKLIVDKDSIQSVLRKYNYILDKHDPQKVFDIYFGDGMHSVFKNNTRIFFDGKEITADYLSHRGVPKNETLFYVPAQRILSMSDGRAKNFMEFDMSTPYVLRSFSETLRIYLQGAMGDPDVVFPYKPRLKSDMKRLFNESIFHDGKVIMEESSGLKKMMMSIDGKAKIPFMTWSAGQKEFMPLLLSFYCLSGPRSQVFKRENYKYAVIEEPEMALHPQAIWAVLLEILELLSIGYKVVISTHSTVFLDFAWAFNAIKGSHHPNKVNSLYELFGVEKDSTIRTFLDKLYDKTISTYYFSKEEGDVLSKDISPLDAGSDNIDLAEWGGLVKYSSRVADVVYKYIDG